MSNRWRRCLPLTVALSLSTPAAQAESLDLLRYALMGGTPNLDLRMRYEYVDQADASTGPAASRTLKEAEAFTVRTRLGYTTGKWNDFDMQVELEDTHALGDEQYNSCPGTVTSAECNRKSNRSLIADPDGSELNQVWIRYTSGLPGTMLKLGRQRLVLDNARFVGNVGWRQNEMTYDALSVVNNSLLPKTTLTYAYLTNAHYIFFDELRMQSHVLNASLLYSEQFNASAYAYLLDFKNDPAATAALNQQRRDTQTYGVRAFGAIPMAPVKLLYAAEYAKQLRYADSPSGVKGHFYLLEGGLNVQWFTAKLSYEELSGSGVTGYGFQTPLATLHAFQGWADMFLTTPATGIQDTYLTLSANLLGSTISAIYHDYQSDSASKNYGSEVNLLGSYPINDNFSVTAKYASYKADDPAAPAGNRDTSKVWFQAEYKF